MVVVSVDIVILKMYEILCIDLHNWRKFDKSFKIK